ncbi:MAG: ABC transporter substrate-binding protein [Patescibacteria group bacterium]
MKRYFLRRARTYCASTLRRIVVSLRQHTSATIDHLLIAQLSGRRIPSLKQFTYLFRVLTDKERIQFSVLFLVSLVSGAWMSIQLWQRVYIRIPAGGGMYTEGIVGSPQYLNPLYARSNEADRDLTELLFAGLVRFSAGGIVEPDLAETVEVSEDAKTYTITLRENLTWSDGEPVTSNDIKFTVEAIQNPEYRSPLQQNFSEVAVETINQRSARLILKNPSAPFLENLTLGLLPSHLWANIEPKYALLTELNTKPVSVGPYQFASLTKDPGGAIRSYTLLRRTQGVPYTPYIATLTIKFYSETADAVAALKNKTIDGLALFSQETRENTTTVRNNLTQYRIQIPQYTAIFFNTKENDVLTNRAVREALALAIDRSQILQSVLASQGELVDSPILAGTVGYRTHASSTPFDAPRAIAVLEASGWTLPEGRSVRHHAVLKQDLQIKLTTLNVPELYRMAEMIQKQWQSIGMSTDLEIVDSARFTQDIIRPRAFQALLIGETTGIDPDPYPFWHSSGIGERGLNLSDFLNRDADKLLEEARKTTDPKVRDDRYAAFQEILLQERPAIFLFTPSYAYDIDKKVQGISFPKLMTPSDRFSHINEWFIETDWKLR